MEIPSFEIDLLQYRFQSHIVSHRTNVENKVLEWYINITMMLPLC